MGFWKKVKSNKERRWKIKLKILYVILIRTKEKVSCIYQRKIINRKIRNLSLKERKDYWIEIIKVKIK